MALSADAVFLLDGPQGGILDINPTAAEWLGKTSEAVQGTLLPAYIHPDDRAVVTERLLGFPLEPGPPLELRCQIDGVNGSIIPCEMRVTVVGVGSCGRLIAVFNDLSDRQRAMEEIRLRNVAIASISAGVAIADARLPDLPLIYVNKGFEEITGYKAREAVGRSCRFLQGAARDQPALQVLRNALNQGEPCDVRLRNFRKDGTPFWNELHISPVRDDQGELTHFVGIQIDVTDRVESRKQIEESERRYRTLADSIEDIIMRRDRSGRILFVSAAVERNLGWRVGELTGGNYHALIHPEDAEKFVHNLALLSTADDSVTLTYRVRTASGEYIWIESLETLSRGEHDRDEVISVGRDVTIRQKEDKEVRESLEKERELSEMKTRFIRMVSHEFRTPMTGIRASSAFLQQWGDQIPAEKRERHFSNIESSLARMNRMLDEVLFLSKDEVKRVHFNPVEVNLLDFCEQVMDELRPMFPKRKITFEVCDAAAGVFLLDPDLLHHIFQNLLSNALKYSPPEEPIEFSVCRDRNTGELVWKVRDRGIGIPEQDQATLFEPFSRADNTGNIGGTGLGLNIVKRSVELHGGRISYATQEGHGTEFEVRLPITSTP